MKYLILLLCLMTATVTANERWYQDTNRRVAGGLPHDFYSRMSNPDFKNIICKADVYYFRLSSVKKVKDKALRQLAGILKSCNVKTALDDGTVAWAHGRQKKPQFKVSIKTIKRLRRLGFDVQYIGMQSVLSKPSKKFPQYKNFKNMLPRYLDILSYYQKVGKKFPHIKIGLIDALPAKLPDLLVRQNYKTVVNELKRRGFKLSFIHLDLPVSYPRKRIRGNSWSSIAALSKYIQNDLKTKFGVFLVSNLGGKKSGQQATKNVRHGLQNLLRAGVRADSYISSSWYKYPQFSMPVINNTSLGRFNQIDILLNRWGIK